MTGPEIYILTGPKHSGKTSLVQQWCKGRTDVHGLLSPVIDGKRFFMDIDTGQTFFMETDDADTNAIEVGRFRFSRASFEKASHLLEISAKKKGWLILDECGPLELKGEGFAATLTHILQTPAPGVKLVILVRDTLVHEMIRYFDLRQWKYFTEAQSDQQF